MLRAELQQNIRHQAGDDNRITGAAEAHESPRQCRLKIHTIFTHQQRRSSCSASVKTIANFFKAKNLPRQIYDNRAEMEKIGAKARHCASSSPPTQKTLVNTGEEGAWVGWAHHYHKILQLAGRGEKVGKKNEFQILKFQLHCRFALSVEIIYTHFRAISHCMQPFMF